MRFRDRSRLFEFERDSQSKCREIGAENRLAAVGSARLVSSISQGPSELRLNFVRLIRNNTLYLQKSP